LTDLACWDQHINVAAEPHFHLETPRFDFDEIYHANISYLWRTLQRLGVPSADLEDRTHDVFSVVFRKQDSFDPSLAVRPWLFGIALRVASDARKRAKKRETQEWNENLADPGLAQDESSAKRQLVMRGLAELSLDQRAVVIMHDLDGYTAPEISKYLNIELNTVYSRLRLGRARFVSVVRELESEER